METNTFDIAIAVSVGALAIITFTILLGHTLEQFFGDD